MFEEIGIVELAGLALGQGASCAMALADLDVEGRSAPSARDAGAL